MGGDPRHRSSGTVVFASAGALAASAAVRWRAKATAVCVTTGAGGTWFVSVDVIYSRASGANLTSLTFSATSTAGTVAQSTTAAISMSISAGWSTVIPGQTFNGLYSKIGRAI